MTDDRPTDAEFDRLRAIADYQFSGGAGRALFSSRDEIAIQRTSSGRIEQALRRTDGDLDDRLITQGVDGRFTISVAAGRLLADAFDPPRNRVVVGDESVPFVSEGRNAFAKFVIDVDDELRPGDEALVVHDGELLGVGRAELAPDAMRDFETGVAVKVRHGAGKNEERPDG